MSLWKALVGAVAGGVIGALIWFLVSYTTGYEIGWIAWGVGALTGLGVRLMTQSEGGLMTGLIAGAVALLAIFIGKYVTVRLLVDSAFANVPAVSVSDQEVMLPIADEVIGEFTKKNKKLRWPPGMSVEEAHKAEDYPKDVWAEAQKRFSALSKEQLDARKKDMLDHKSEFVGQLRSAMHSEATRRLFRPRDALWALLALASAFRIGGGTGQGRA